MLLQLNDNIANDFLFIVSGQNPRDSWFLLNGFGDNVLWWTGILQYFERIS